MIVDTDTYTKISFGRDTTSNTNTAGGFRLDNIRFGCTVGVMCSGVTAAEPGTFLLLGLGLTLIAARRKNIFRKTQGSH